MQRGRRHGLTQNAPVHLAARLTCVGLVRANVALSCGFWGCFCVKTIFPDEDKLKMSKTLEKLQVSGRQKMLHHGTRS